MNKLLEVNKKIAQLLENKSYYPNCGLYHYTDMSGLEGILSTRRLWMTNYKSLADKDELNYAREIVLEILSGFRENSAHSDFWQKYNKKFQNIFEIGDYFICSFSHLNNNSKLWRDYAKKGGVAIKFRKEYFTPVSTMRKRKRRYNLTTVQYVQYEIDEFLDKAKTLICFIDTFLENNNSSLDRELAARLTIYFMADMPKIKKNFSDEQECRLFQFGYSKKMNNDLDKKDRIYAIPQVQRGNKLVVLRKFKQKDICEIIFDSSCDKEKIKWLLHKYQFTGVKIQSRKNPSNLI